LDKTKEAALQGDLVAMRLLLEKTLPSTKAIAATVKLPALTDKAPYRRDVLIII
jgi:hypothetical protein